jgi:hypothetical protein
MKILTKTKHVVNNEIWEINTLPENKSKQDQFNQS